MQPFPNASVKLLVVATDHTLGTLFPKHKTQDPSDYSASRRRRPGYRPTRSSNLGAGNRSGQRSGGTACATSGNQSEVTSGYVPPAVIKPSPSGIVGGDRGPDREASPACVAAKALSCRLLPPTHDPIVSFIDLSLPAALPCHMASSCHGSSPRPMTPHQI